MVIEVTQDDIDKGVKNNACQCPVARAIARGTEEEWVVDSHSLVRMRDARVWHTPPAAYWFINRYDQGESVEPFTFELPID